MKITKKREQTNSKKNLENSDFSPRKVGSSNNNQYKENELISSCMVSANKKENESFRKLKMSESESCGIGQSVHKRIISDREQVMKTGDHNSRKDSSSKNVPRLTIGNVCQAKQIPNLKERLLSPKNSMTSKSGTKINENLKSRLQASPLRGYNLFEKAYISSNCLKKSREASNSEPKPQKSLQKVSCLPKKSVSPEPSNNRKSAVGVVLNGTHKYPISEIFRKPNQNTSPVRTYEKPVIQRSFAINKIKAQNNPVPVSTKTRVIHEDYKYSDEDTPNFESNQDSEVSEGFHSQKCCCNCKCSKNNQIEGNGRSHTNSFNIKPNFERDRSKIFSFGFGP